MNYLQKKKLAFMSIVNRVKGFVRTVTGVFPLTLTNCVDEESIIDYSIYGQSVQDGTPTPIAPVEVESVGDKTTNLISWDYMLGDATYPITKVENGYYAEKYFNAFLKNSDLIKHIKTVLKPNVTYTLSRIYSGTRDIANGMIAIQNSASENIVQCTYGVGLVRTTFTLTQDQIDSIDHLYIYFHNNGGTITKLQLTESDTVLPYEPYGKYKIPITVSGKNLIKPQRTIGSYTVNGVTWTTNADYSITLNGTATATYGQTISIDNGFTKADTTYTVCGCFGGSTSTYYLQTQNGFRDTGNGVAITTINDKNAITLYVVEGAVLDNVTVYPMLIKGNYVGKVPDYEPYHEPITTNIYLDEPLRKVGGYADYIDFEGGKVVRNVGKYTFTGAENDQGGANGDPYCFGYTIYLYGLSLTSNKIGLCKHLPIYKVVGSVNESRLAFHTAANHPYCYVFFAKRDFPDLEEYISPTSAKQVVKDMYDSGEPLVLYYNRNKPTETPITLPTIPTFKGTTILTADTTIQPSNAEITYYSTAKE